MSVCDGLTGSILYWLGGGWFSLSRLYLARLASTKNNIPAGKRNKDPKTPNAKDQERSLCSQCGIQSLLSPFAPKMSTAIKPKNPASTKSVPTVNRSKIYLSWCRLQNKYIHVRNIATKTKVRHSVKKNWVAMKKPGSRRSWIM